MPENKRPFELVTFAMVGIPWAKGKDGWWTLQFNSAHVATVASGLMITDKKVFRSAVNCLSELSKESME